MDATWADVCGRVTRRIALDPVEHAATVRDLKLAAIEARRRILYMGYHNRITLHYGALFSMIEITVALYLGWMRLKYGDPTWPERDRFVLSKGHGAPAVYVALWMCGYLDEKHFNGFRRLGSILQGHPDRLKTPGIEATSGSLGQGMPVACGMALGAKIDHAPYRVYTLMSDGECNEGSVWEAAQIAANLRLDRLTVLIDWNGKSSYGWMKGRNDIEPLADKWRAFNWSVFECDGHDFVSLTGALALAESVRDRPSVILCHTVKGKGLTMVETYKTKPNILLGEAEYNACLAELAEAEQAARR